MQGAKIASHNRLAWSLPDWLAWQEQLSPNRIELGLDRVREVADRLELLPTAATTLTIAGTNGKGSSAVLAAAIYDNAGYRAGCYTSPHLWRYNERIVIDGSPVTDRQLCAAFCAVDAARGDVMLTYFEFGTLAALWLFRQAQVTVQVLEVGLGGRLDAVNIVDADCAMVTEVGLDHQAWLGPDRETIGFEKGGVYRANRPAICVDPDPPQSLIRQARACDLRCIGRDFDFDRHGKTWSWRGRAQQFSGLPLPPVAGEVQCRNAAGVLAAVEVLAAVLPVSTRAIHAALHATQLPGRLESRGGLLLDVAHNVDAVDALVAHLRQLDPAPRALVLGMMRDKAVEAVAKRLAEKFDSVHAAALPPPRGLSGRELAARVLGCGMQVQAHASVEAALVAARATPGSGMIVVCGSFRTVAAAAETKLAD